VAKGFFGTFPKPVRGECHQIDELVIIGNILNFKPATTNKTYSL
jgi:hypothetical protein